MCEDPRQKESSDPQLGSPTSHGATVLAIKLDVYVRQHRKITYLQDLF